MPRSSVRSTTITGSSRKVAAARAAVARSVRVLRSRNARLRRRNVSTAGFLGIETKYVDYSYSGAVVSDANMASGEADPATVLCLNGCAQGDGETQRDGRDYTIKSLFINGQISAATQANQTQGDDNLPVFIAVVHDTQTNGAQLDSELVFTNPAANANRCALPFRNMKYLKRFKILWSKTFTIETPSISYDGTNVEQMGARPIAFKVALPNLGIKVNCKDTGATIADITDNSLHVLAFTGSTNLVPTLQYNSRCRFVG